MKMFTNDYDWVIADDVNDVLFEMMKHSGYESLAEYQNDTEDEPSNWRELSPYEKLSFYKDEERTEENKETKTVAEWIEEHGRGHFAGDDN